MTLHVSLPTELEQLVHQQVKAGLYDNASEVVEEALHSFFHAPHPQEFSADFIQDMQNRAERVKSGQAQLTDGEAFFQSLGEKHGL
jgi:antitoxin ParD1/3/4